MPLDLPDGLEFAGRDWWPDDATTTALLEAEPAPQRPLIDDAVMARFLAWCERRQKGEAR